MKKLIVLSIIIVFVAALLVAAFPAQTGNAAVAVVCPRVGWNSKPISGCSGIAIVLPTYPVKITPLVGWNS